MPALTDDQLTAAYQVANNGASPSASHLGQMRQRANELIGTPYLWGGTTKAGIDCSAFISSVWGVNRQTTDTLGSVAQPVSKDALQPGDALNLTTGQDPRGYGHVRMFDGWADPERKTAYVYESAASTGGVVRRVVNYDDKYQPMRLAGESQQAPQTAAEIEAASRAAGITTPLRSGGKPAPPAERQRFLEANAPGESTAIVPKDQPTGYGVAPAKATTADTSAPDEDPATKALREQVDALQQADAYSRHLTDQLGAVPEAPKPYAMPSLQWPKLPGVRPYQAPVATGYGVA